MNRRITAAHLKRAIEILLKNAVEDEGQMLEVAEAFAPYAQGKAYTAGDIFRHGKNTVGDSQLYRVLQSHVSQAEWIPGEAAGLYKPIGIGEDGIPIWSQPVGVQDAYARGDEVRHKGTVWESDVDGNVWEPGIYGWSEK